MTEDERKGVWSVESLRIHLTAVINDKFGAAQADRDRIKEFGAAEIAAVRKEIEGFKELFRQAREDDKQAVATANVAIEKRLDGMNEFRGQVSDQARMMIPRTEADARMGAIDKEINTLTTRMDRGTGQNEGSRATIAMMVAVIGTLIGVASLIVALVRTVNIKQP